MKMVSESKISHQESISGEEKVTDGLFKKRFVDFYEFEKTAFTERLKSSHSTARKKSVLVY